MKAEKREASAVRTFLAAVFALVAMAGCVNVGPDYSEPDLGDRASYALPDAGYPTTNRTDIGEWKSAEGADDVRALVTTNDISNWWCRFDDVALTNLVAGAVDGNLSFRMAQKRLDQSRWALLGAIAAFLPKADFSASGTMTHSERYTSSQYSSWMTTGSKRNYGDLFRAGFDMTWEIDIFGGNRRATEAAWAESQAAEWSLADAWVTLTAEVGREYIELRTTQQRIAVARTNLVLQTETYDILKSRFDSGIGDELAVNQSKYLVDQTLATIPPLLAQEEKLLNALAVLAGDMPGSRHDELRECPDRDWLLEPSKVAEVPLDMIRSRPDVRAAERRLAAQTARVGVAKALWYPKLYINGTLGIESVKVHKFLGKGDFYGAIGPAVSWPIFHGGSLYANEKAEESKMDEAFLAYESAIQGAYREVRDTYAAYTQEYHRYQALQGAVKAAQDAVTIAKDLYKNGLRDFTAVIDAQRSLLALEEALVISRGQITIDLIALFKALGGGFPGI
jgi:NodT family efflux transporter outer membrane factor (OMF) lipoprotein